MKRAAIVVLFCAAACLSPPLSAHVRSQSHSVWEINGQFVDVVVTIPDIEAKRLAADAGSVTGEQVRDYLTPKIYAVADGKRAALGMVNHG